LLRTQVESIGTDLIIQKDFSDYLLSKQSLLRIMIAFSSSLPSNASFNRTNFLVYLVIDHFKVGVGIVIVV